MYQRVCRYDWIRIVELSETLEKHSVITDVITGRDLSDFVMVERWLQSVSDVALIKKFYTYRISCCLCASSSFWSASFCCGAEELLSSIWQMWTLPYHIWGPSHFLQNNLSTAHHCHRLPTWILAAICDIHPGVYSCPQNRGHYNSKLIMTKDFNMEMEDL